jgi:hypothetical protein
MCRQVKCKQCGKITWAGCGMHVDQVMASVPSSQRCPGHAQRAAKAAPAGGPGLWSRLFGR